jgi:putative tryptophan/tyrosine transport system substrate-binding protein
MRRREFIRLVASAAAAWPLAAYAQQMDRVRRIGVLTGFSENDPEIQRRVTAFLDQLRKLGWMDGRNIRIDYRWGAGDANRIRAYAAELVRLGPDVILVNSSSVLRPLQQETSSIPIVFVQVSDPVVSGFVASLAHPGGNITGFTPAEISMGGKWLEVLKEVAPSTNVAAAILSSTSPVGAMISRAAEAVAPTLGMRLTMSRVRDGTEIEHAVQDFAQQSNGGLVVLADPVTNIHRKLIISLAAQHRLPAVYNYRYFVTEGGLISYGIDPADPYRQAASYIHRILMGEKPADMPVQQPTKYELVINLKTAKELGLSIPQTLLATADEVGRIGHDFAAPHFVGFWHEFDIPRRVLFGRFGAKAVMAPGATSPRLMTVPLG